jgi:probable rRNA maturation factor
MKPEAKRPPKVEVRNLQNKNAVDLAGLEKFARRATALCLRLRRKDKTDLKSLTEIAVLIISDRRMSALHHRFMGQSDPTDVITFQHGEIFISAETARRNAQRFGNSFNRELRLYVVHGLLHLHGFDDRNVQSAQRMKSVQTRILGQASRLK